ncbi:MAG: phosphatidate cytidylyltransferase [Pirellulaceae bacterium]|nr:phosphatidate cytidylyltransferase [Pirellulaceae bacterium]
MNFDEATWRRLFGYWVTFESPLTMGIVFVVVGALIGFGFFLRKEKDSSKFSPEMYQELESRWKSWCWLVLAIFSPILLGAAWTIAAVTVLSLLCFREFARAVAITNEKVLGLCVIFCILGLAFASLDHYDRLYFAIGPLGSTLIVLVTIASDRPSGFVRRTALTLLGFHLFGFSLGYLGLIANVGDIGNGVDYRLILILIFLAVELNDIFAFCCGKYFQGPKLLPLTSPGKTVSGSCGALCLTTLLVVVLGHFIFEKTAMDSLEKLVTLGVLISGLGQLGDFLLSSIKRDVGIKDMGNSIPGHGGLLDRFDSLVLIAPAIYHYLSFHLGVLGNNQTHQIFSG